MSLLESLKRRWVQWSFRPFHSAMKMMMRTMMKRMIQFHLRYSKW
jgi:hypothetical protein